MRPAIARAAEAIQVESGEKCTDDEKAALAKQDRIESIKQQIRKAHDRNDAIAVSKLEKELAAIK